MTRTTEIDRVGGAELSRVENLGIACLRNSQQFVRLHQLHMIRTSAMASLAADSQNQTGLLKLSADNRSRRVATEAARNFPPTNRTIHRFFQRSSRRSQRPSWCEMQIL